VIRNSPVDGLDLCNLRACLAHRLTYIFEMADERQLGTKSVRAI